MSRPETHADLPNHEKSETWATFSLHQFTDRPDVMAAYAAFCQAATRAGASMTRAGDVVRTASPEELDTLLASKQKSWDASHARYTEVREAYKAGFGDLSALSSPWQDSEAWAVRYFAEQNDLPVFDLIAKYADVRANARRLLNGGPTVTAL